MSVKDLAVELLGKSRVTTTENCRILDINLPFLVAVATVRRLLEARGVECVITSAADFDPTRKLHYHAKGYAWDFRSRDVNQPEMVHETMRMELHAIDKRFHTLYHHGSTGMHFHVEYRFDEP